MTRTTVHSSGRSRSPPGPTVRPAAIAPWLNERGYRTRAGRPWGYKTILKVLRNPIYAGDIAFRGATRAGDHQALIDRATFDACRTLLDARGEDYSLRASNPSEYLLAGLLRCAGCGKRLVGTSAHGRRYRYRYYTCIGRQYGRNGCRAARLAADHAEDRVRAALLDVYASKLADLRTEFLKATAAVFRRHRAGLERLVTALHRPVALARR